MTSSTMLYVLQVADSVQFPCKYVSSGCREKMHHTTKRLHEEQCPFRPYSCPCPGTTCTWQGGNLDMVLNHLLSAHKTITTLVGEDIVFLATDINLPGRQKLSNNAAVLLLTCIINHFVGSQMICTVLCKLVGAVKVEARKYLVATIQTSVVLKTNGIGM